MLTKKSASGIRARSDIPSDLVRRFVRCKHEMDEALKNKQALPYGFEESWPSTWNKSWRTIDPYTYMKVVWPFWEGNSLTVSNDKRLLKIAPDLVVGASDAWQPHDKTSAELDKLFLKTEAQVQHFEKTGEWKSFIEGCGYIGAHPQAHELSPFGLYIALEGKNRVAAYRHRNVPIAYDVSAVHYPPADDLLLTLIGGDWHIDWQNHGGFKIRYCAEIVVALLMAYGVDVNE